MKTLEPLKWDCVTKTKRNGQVWRTHYDCVCDWCPVICGKTEKEVQKNAKIAFKQIKKECRKKGTILKACFNVNRNPFTAEWVVPMSIYILEKGKKPKWERTNLMHHRAKGK